MTTITTSTSANATAYGNQRKIDRTSNGVLWVVDLVTSTTGTSPLALSYSVDQGTTWLSGGYIFNGSGLAAVSYTSDASLFIDADDYAHVVFKDNNNGFLYYRRGTPNAARTAYTWSTATLLYNAVTGDVPDVVAFRDPAGGGGWTAHVVFSIKATNIQTYYSRVNITSAGVVTAVAAAPVSTNYGTTAAHTYPSIDFQHTGDGKTPVAAPALFVGWSAAAAGSGFGIRFKKATYASGAWTWGTEREIDSTTYLAAGNGTWLTTMFDGARVVMVGWVVGADSHLIIHDRDTADTTTTTRTVVTNAAASDVQLGGSATYDTTGNIYVVGTGSSPLTLSWRKWTRAGASLGALNAVDTSSPQIPYASARRGTTGSRIDYVYTDGAASPFTVTYGTVTLNQAPTAPTGLTPAAGSVDRTVVQRFAWTVNDPDAGDSQSQADVQWRTNNSGSTGAWQPVTVTGPNPWWDAPAGTFPAGGIEWQVRSYDAQGLVGPWSASAFATAGTSPPAPTITSPVSGATIPTSSVTVTFSEPGLDGFDWRVLADKAGVADPTVVVNAGNTVTGPTGRAFTVTGLPNGVTVHFQVRVSYQGLKSTWADQANPVSYTAPPKPTVVLAGNDTTGALLVTATNPTPTGTQPAVTVNEVWVDDGAGFTRRKTDLAPNGAWAYRLPLSGRDYTNAVRVVAVAANGTTTTS